MTTRTVTMTVLQNDQTAYTVPAVIIQLVSDFEDGGVVYPKGITLVTTDSTGHASVDLAVPNTGTAHYVIYLINGLATDIYLAAGAAVDLQTLLVIPGLSVAQDVLQTIIDSFSVLAFETITSAYVIPPGYDGVIRCSGTFAVTLPATTASGWAYGIENVGIGLITVTAAGADLIRGASTLVLTPYQYCTFYDAVAGAWDVLGGA